MSGEAIFERWWRSCLSLQLTVNGYFNLTLIGQNPGTPNVKYQSYLVLTKFRRTILWVIRKDLTGWVGVPIAFLFRSAQLGHNGRERENGKVVRVFLEL